MNSCMSWLTALVLVVGFVPGRDDAQQLLYVILYFYNNLFLLLHDSAADSYQ